MYKIVLLITLFSLASCSDYARLVNNEIDSPALNKTTGSIKVLDYRALLYINLNTKIKIRGTGFEWTEGPLWIESGSFLIFSDIPSNKIYKYDPATESTSLYLAPAGATRLYEHDDMSGSNGLVLNDRNELVLFQQGDRRVAKMDADILTPKPKFSTLSATYEGKRLNSPNDGVFDSEENLYFTDPPYGMKNGINDKRKELSFQGVFQLTAQGEIRLLDNTVSYPNGIGLSNDDKTLYVAVSNPVFPHWLAYDLNEVGKATNKRIFYDASDLLGKDGQQGYPDGMAVHSSGVIFATGPGGVWLFTPEGEIIAKIYTGHLTSNCALTQDEKTLYITADDYLLSVALK